jgi:hypothetical protein
MKDGLIWRGIESLDICVIKACERSYGPQVMVNVSVIGICPRTP